MGKKLIFLDVDGTLTAPASAVPPESALTAIRRAQENGHKVFLCTGRNWMEFKDLLHHGFDGVVGSAGGYILCGDRVLYNHPMSAALRTKTVDTLLQAGAAYTMEAKDVVYQSPEFECFLSEADRSPSSEIRRWRKMLSAREGICPTEKYDGRPIYKIIFITKELSRMAQAERELEKDFFVCYLNILKSREIRHGELINRAFSKGTGIELLCRHFGMSMADTVAMGDSMNDATMLEVAGTSVCMENGEEALKRISDLVCPPVEQDGLYQAFLQLKLI